jgi:hypothetical protein
MLDFDSLKAEFDGKIDRRCEEYTNAHFLELLDLICKYRWQALLV